MIRARIVKNWADFWMNDSEFIAQTPNCSGRWGNVEFTLAEIKEPDYLIVFNRPRANVTVRCRPSCIWGFIQEPPNEIFRSMHKGQRAFGRVFMSDEGNVGGRFILSHPPLPYFVGKSFDDLVDMSIPPKERCVSCITSKTRFFQGHVDRLEFLEQLGKHVEMDMYGRYIKPIASKWDALAPYKYSVVLENCVHPWYWSEKLSDCFLSWTMPLYVGCPRIGQYFPSQSFVALDRHSPERAAEQILQVVTSGAWERNFESLQEARRRTLFQYGCFPYIASLIEKFEVTRDGLEQPVQVNVRAITPRILETWIRSKSRAWRLDLPSWAARKIRSFRPGCLENDESL